MSSAVVSTPAALGRPFVFDPKADSGVCSPSGVNSAVAESSPLARLQSAIKNQQSKISPARVTPASQLDIRPAPEMVSSGAPAIDALTGGLPRGCLTEICGPASSGRTTFLLAALAAATRRGEFCTLVDASDTLDPHSAASAGVALDRLLWVRCGDNSLQRHRGTEKYGDQKGCPISRASLAREVGISSQAAFDFDRTSLRQSERRLEQVLRATDLLLESGGFGLIVLDLADLPPQAARHIPLTTWFRFRRAIEHTPTILLAIEQHPIAGSCSSLLLQLGAQNNSEETMTWAQSNCSREAAVWESPARQCRVGMKKENESRRACPEQAKRTEGDGPALGVVTDANYDDSQSIDVPMHAHLLTGLKINAELIRSRLERKPARSVTFPTKTVWAG
jgi:recA bacterial DNA recombination protein